VGCQGQQAVAVIAAPQREKRVRLRVEPKVVVVN